MTRCLIQDDENKIQGKGLKQGVTLRVRSIFYQSINRVGKITDFGLIISLLFCLPDFSTSHFLNLIQDC